MSNPRYRNRNPVAKNIDKFNRPATHIDKKKESKKSGVDNRDDYMHHEYNEPLSDDGFYENYKKRFGNTTVEEE